MTSLKQQIRDLDSIVLTNIHPTEPFVRRDKVEGLLADYECISKRELNFLFRAEDRRWKESKRQIKSRFLKFLEKFDLEDLK